MKQKYRFVKDIKIIKYFIKKNKKIKLKKK